MNSPEMPELSQNTFDRPVRVWSYVVLAAATLSHMIGEGFSYGFLGFFNIAQTEYYNITITSSSWTGGIHLATSVIAAPVAGALTQSLSLRCVQIAGGIVTMIGIGASAFTLHPSEIRLLYGFIAGLGISLVRTSSTSIISNHFGHEWINFALGALMIGSSCGLIAFPMISCYLFSNHEFSNVLLIITVIMGLHVICGLTYSERPQDLEESIFNRTEDYTVEEDEPHCGCRRLCRAVFNVLTYMPNWAYLLAACYQMFGVSAFFSLLPNYIVQDTSLTKEQAAQGSMSLGSVAVVGIVAVSVTSHLDYNKLLPLTVSPIICGGVTMLITEIENEISYTMLMALYGLSYGILITSHMNVAHGQSLDKDERLVFSTLQLILESVGCLLGPPLTGLIEHIFYKKMGIYFAASSSIKAGFCFVPILVYQYVIKRCIEARKEKDKKPATLIRIKGYDTKQVKYQHLLQQDPELTPLKSDIHVY